MNITADDAKKIADRISKAMSQSKKTGNALQHCELLELIAQAANHRNYRALQAQSKKQGKSQEPVQAPKPWEPGRGLKSQAQHVADEGCRCPNCGSKDIEAGDYDFDGDTAWSNVVCLDCQTQYTENYTLSGYDIVELGDSVVAGAEADTGVQEAETVTYVATFMPQAWVDNCAVEVRVDAEHTFDVTPEVLAFLESNGRMPDNYSEETDALRGAKCAPQWVRDWEGLYSVTVEKIVK